MIVDGRPAAHFGVDPEILAATVGRLDHEHERNAVADLQCPRKAREAHPIGPGRENDRRA